MPNAIGSTGSNDEPTVNLAPPNAYLAATLKLWQQGHFLNFNGLTRLVSALWAFVALAYLMFLAARRREAVGR